MKYGNILAAFTGGAMLMFLAMSITLPGEDDTPVETYRDDDNGCMYYITQQGDITPRLKPDGSQVCPSEYLGENGFVYDGESFR